MRGASTESTSTAFVPGRARQSTGGLPGLVRQRLDDRRARPTTPTNGSAARAQAGQSSRPKHPRPSAAAARRGPASASVATRRARCGSARPAPAREVVDGRALGRSPARAAARPRQQRLVACRPGAWLHIPKSRSPAASDQLLTHGASLCDLRRCAQRSIGGGVFGAACACSRLDVADEGVLARGGVF